ncbi:GATA-domain-containing protein [Marasmius fiardii PR-910]|nr:GATA-domain-containing protein [Marasmius fiardii PR-910]
MSSIQASTSQKSTPLPQTFEFTKRKRWADLLVAELADANIFILSSNFRILYCGAAVKELLGWTESQLVDHDFGDIIGVDDQNHFRACFEESMSRGTELISYIRLRCNTPAASYPYSLMKEILFEIKGYPRFAKQDSFGNIDQFFFALAKPYLSRNTAMLNTVLELQLENEHLQRKLRTLKSKLQSGSTNAQYSVLSGPGQRTSVDSYYSSNGMEGRHNNMYDATKTSAGRGSFDLTGPSTGALDGANEELEDGSKKKKLKKSHAPEQYVCVTCGRTDSPEWRKGPLGPKTLCNACGLRWAKQMRKTDDPPSHTTGDTTAN